MRNGLCRLFGVMRRLNQFAALLLVLAILFGASSVYAKAKKKTQKKTEEIHANTSSSVSSGMVIITSKGKKYHNPGCRTVKKTYQILTVEEARSKGYTPCKVCGAE